MSDDGGTFGPPFDVSYDTHGLLWRGGTFYAPGDSSTSDYVAAYVGDLAELFFVAGTPVDITDPDVRAKFIDPDALLPVRIDAGGLWPFFDSLGVVSQIWLSGNQDLFPRNYPGWSATCVSQTDSDQHHSLPWSATSRRPTATPSAPRSQASDLHPDGDLGPP